MFRNVRDRYFSMEVRPQNLCLVGSGEVFPWLADGRSSNRIKFQPNLKRFPRCDLRSGRCYRRWLHDFQLDGNQCVPELLETASEPREDPALLGLPRVFPTLPGASIRGILKSVALRPERGLRADNAFNPAVLCEMLCRANAAQLTVSQCDRIAMSRHVCAESSGAHSERQGDN